MQKLYSAANLQDAYLLLHRLERAGIEARVLNEHAQGGMGELPFTQVYPEVWVVDATHAVRARTIIREHEQAESDGNPRVCSSCNEENPRSFDICWRCGNGLDT